MGESKRFLFLPLPLFPFILSVQSVSEVLQVFSKGPFGAPLLPFDLITTEKVSPDDLLCVFLPVIPSNCPNSIRSQEFLS